MAPSAMIAEAGLFTAAHAASSAILCRVPVTTTSDPQVERQRRVTMAAAVALLAVSTRWRESSRQFVAAALLTKLIPFFEGDRKTVGWVAAIFMPVAAEMWIRWPAAACGKNTTVHGNFSGTMGKLTGVGNVKAFGANPEKALNFGISDFAKTTQRSVTWSIRTLSVVYTLQAVVGWMRSRGRKPKEGSKQKTLQDRLQNAVVCTLRTTMVYTLLSQYSVWAYARHGHLRSRLWSLPSAVFLIEPLERAISLAEYYIAHLMFVVMSEVRAATVGGTAFPALLTAGALGLYAAAGAAPPLYGVLAGVADAVAPRPRKGKGSGKPTNTVEE